MAHIHLQDGALPLPALLLWWATAVIIILVCIWWARRRRTTDPAVITIAAFCTAAAFAVFQVSLPVFGGVHINLTPLIGILTGPFIGGIVVLIVNLLSAAIGHGGYGMIGANIILNIVEVTVSYLVFRVLARLTSSVFTRAAVATVVGLVAGNLVMIGIIVVSGVQGVTLGLAGMIQGLSLIAAVNLGVAVIEALVTGFIVDRIARARPDLVRGVS
jgi:cobalt/nickel transport system permease protein